MKSRRLYILIIALLIMGVFETFRGLTLKTRTSNNTQVSPQDLKDFDLKPFHITKAQSSPAKSKFHFKKVRTRTKKTKNTFDFAKTHTFSAGNEQANKKTAKGKKKTKKKKEADKDKTKKKEDEKDTDIAEGTTDPDYYSDDEKPNLPTDPQQSAGFLGKETDSTGQNKNEIPQSFNEWAVILLNNPSYKKVVEFLAHYQSRRISADVFYEVLTALAEDPREEVNIYGVRAAGSTPSYRSFHYLTTVIAEPTLTQKVRGLGRTQLEVYQNIQYLSVLNSIVLNSEFSYAKTLAATLIAKSARTHLQSDKNVKSDDSGNANTLDNNNNRSPAVTASVIKNFEESKEVLSNVLHLGDLDTSLASALNEAILAIDDSLT